MPVSLHSQISSYPCMQRNSEPTKSSTDIKITSNSPTTPLIQINNNSLFGTQRSLLRIRTKSKQHSMICPINLSTTLWHNAKSPRVGGWVGRKTKQYNTTSLVSGLLWCILEVKSDTKWNTKLLKSDTRGCLSKEGNKKETRRRQGQL